MHRPCEQTLSRVCSVLANERKSLDAPTTLGAWLVGTPHRSEEAR